MFCTSFELSVSLDLISIENRGSPCTQVCDTTKPPRRLDGSNPPPPVALLERITVPNKGEDDSKENHLYLQFLRYLDMQEAMQSMTSFDG